MKRILISLLSKYLQPNFLFIKEMEGKYDKLFIVTTKDMEEKYSSVKFLTEALGVREKEVAYKIVQEDDSLSIKNTLKDVMFDTEDEFLVNLTGGTKIMSISVKEFFDNFPNVKFYYIPEGKNEIRILNSSEQPQKIQYRMNLKEYFTLNRLYFTYENKTLHNEDFANNLFNRLKKANFSRHGVSEMENAQHLETSEDRKYYSGQWFEEYIYFRLKRNYSLMESQIGTGAKIYHSEKDVEGASKNDNEIDVMMVYNNKLYVFECKQTLRKRGDDEKENAETYLYKLAAISKNYGLVVNSYLTTLHKQKKLSDGVQQGINKRANILGIKKVLYAEDIVKGYLQLS